MCLEGDKNRAVSKGGANRGNGVVLMSTEEASVPFVTSEWFL